MKQSSDNKSIPMTSFASGTGHEIRKDIYYYTNQIVNVVFVGDANGWVVIDAGMPNSAAELIAVAENRFGNQKPSAIILTHGHFDHVGNVVELVERWKVPVYAHPLEFPFLKGERAYPDPDTSVEGGLLAKISFVYPHKPIDIREVLLALPENKTVPFLSEWRWIHTPGHTPGHVSFYRERDKTLIAGDAFVTVRTDSFYKVLIQKKEINGPPRYLTTDWEAAKQSVKQLVALKPELAITGHGPYMEGEELRRELSRLADGFDDIAVPDHGRFVRTNNGTRTT
jgi:glyoxylase-like metal-dependent hydrolase (beta-lactamase superfamily II)